jgi:SCP-2 sterol transfer family
MASAAGEFVDGLCAGGPYPVLARTRAVIRLEVTDGRPGDGWTLVVADGRVRQSDDVADADCVLRADAATLEGLASGRVNATAAILRGVLQADGAPEVLAAIQGLLPGPPDSTGPQRPGGRGSA